MNKEKVLTEYFFCNTLQSIVIIPCGYCTCPRVTEAGPFNSEEAKDYLKILREKFDCS